MSFNDISKSELASSMRETGSTITYKGYTTYGLIFHDPTDSLQMSSKQYSINGTVLTLIIATGSLGTLINNDFIYIDSVKHQMYKNILQNDGLETKIWINQA